MIKINNNNNKITIIICIQCNFLICTKTYCSEQLTNHFYLYLPPLNSPQKKKHVKFNKIFKKCNSIKHNTCELENSIMLPIAVFEYFEFIGRLI